MLKGLDAIADVNPAVAPVGDAPEPVTAPSGGDAGRQRVRSGHRRAPHRRREQPRDRAARRRAVCGRAACSRLHDRFRDDQPPAALVHARTARRRRLRSGGFGGGGGGGGFGGGGSGGFGRFQIADTPTLMAVATKTGGTYHGAQDADELRKVFSDLPEGGRKAEAADRDQLDAGGARRAARVSVGRGRRCAGVRTRSGRVSLGGQVAACIDVILR